jgi:preprotein translocase subunit SecG
MSAIVGIAFIVIFIAVATITSQKKSRQTIDSEAYEVMEDEE